MASVFDAFRSFLTCHSTGDSTRCAQGRTFVFAGRRSTLEGSQARQKNGKLRKLDRTLLGRRFASEPRARSSPFFHSVCVSASIFVASARYQTLQGAPVSAPGRPWGPSWCCWGALGTPQDAPETLLGQLRGAFRMPQGVPRRSGSDFDSILTALGAFPGSP